ncbi:MAG: acyl-CoA thioesterase [Caldilineaceae bacterium]|nr:acyl-CoA thioesterase [Caldilineaceae bacterium]MCB9139879.1 acyl-CoA thioesterase [Caldilineaceae bacterium]
MDDSNFPGAIIDIPVRFAETDAMGVVHHAAYVVWFEAGRVALMDAAGTPYVQVADGGHHFAVTRLDVEYRGSIRFGETVKLETRVMALRSRQVRFGYRVYNGAGALAATGHTDHICVDLDGRSAKIPAAVLEQLQNRATE